MAISCDYDPKIKLLIVEDDNETLTLLRDSIILKYPFSEIYCAENGATGLELFKEHSPDLVISDVNMPVRDGIQMSKDIRSINPKVLIIILTAHSDTRFLLEAISNGISYYILKPVDLKLLFDTIDGCRAQIYMQRQLQYQDSHIRKLSRALEQSPVAVVITDSNGAIEYTNPKFTDVTGYTQEEVAGQNLFDQTTPAYLTDPDGKIWGYISSGQQWHGEQCNQNKNGSMFWEAVTISSLLNEEKEIYRYIVVREDISELRHARDEMLKIKKLESLGLLAGGIAHDFNNILTAILGNIFLARLKLKDPELVTNFLQEAEKSANRAKHLTQQLLTFARGGVPIKNVIAVGDLLKEVADLFMQNTKIRFIFAFGDDIWPIEADKGQLLEVFNNLISNAIHAMTDDGTIIISVDNVFSPENDRRFVKISVSDNGSGICEKDLTSIFDPYFTTKQQGKGLGLASCYSIVTKHGGKIRATSTEGKGSIFQISLPATDKVQIPVEAPRQAEVITGSGRILVMDDEMSIRTVTQALLEQFGYSVDCVEDGAEAVEIFQKRKDQGLPFSAVILDLVIPGGVGGKETIEKLLKIDPEVKAIVCSGYSSDPIMANYTDYGFSAVLSKPYRPEDLSKVLKELL